MFFKHIYDSSLAQSSYFVGCQALNQALIIDPQRDVDVYLKLAEENNMKITHITETHIHADFLCGSRELAAITGAKMFLSDEGGPDWQYEFEHEGLKHGDKITVGNLSLEVLHTPGHTPESISFLLTDQPASLEPVMLFTGDFVFVGDIGRPDLLEKAAGLKGTQEIGAHQMFNSIQRFMTLPDHVQLWPAHGAGSACGKSLGSVPISTVGYEKIRNWAFKYTNDQAGFTDYLLDGQPEPPTYFGKMKHLNKVTRPLLTSVPKLPKLTKEQFLESYKTGIQVIDTRTKTNFAQGFIRNSLNVQGNNSFSTWMGWIMNYEQPFILVADDSEIEQLTRKLMRIGLDSCIGFISDVKTLGLELLQSLIIDLETFKKTLIDTDIQLIDTRNRNEYITAHIAGARNLFVGTLQNNLHQLDREKPIIIHCQAGDRAALAYSILLKNGFTNVKNYAAGMKEWLEYKNPVV